MIILDFRWFDIAHHRFWIWIEFSNFPTLAQREGKNSA
jgi:hypothetical protein